MTANRILKVAKECLKGDITGSIINAGYRIRELESYERENFLLVFEGLLRHQVNSIIDEQLSLLSNELGLFSSKPIPRQNLSDRVAVWI
jgi:hypothetical protein